MDLKRAALTTEDAAINTAINTDRLIKGTSQCASKIIDRIFSASSAEDMKTSNHT